ncbi:sugar transferase [Aeromicrobium sp.]|uniref:sugar transferase n=1 Tax=Aeromicrobium sp. TaxID=1871063 RepID=UPI004033307B
MTGRAGSSAVVKRGLDIGLAGLLLVVTLPLQAVLAIAIRTTMGSPVLFSQDRPGLHGQVFTLRKFRTMRDPRPGATSDADRVTRLGRLMRSTSLDELPSLVHVVRGQMSLVGPRPLLVEYLDLYTTEQHRRHEVRPGITGLAQVSGRNNLDWPERLALDVTYVDTRSLRLDIKILVATVAPVLLRRDVNQEGTASMTRFTGSADA